MDLVDILVPAVVAVGLYWLGHHHARGRDAEQRSHERAESNRLEQRELIFTIQDRLNDLGEAAFDAVDYSAEWAVRDEPPDEDDDDDVAETDQLLEESWEARHQAFRIYIFGYSRLLTLLTRLDDEDLAWAVKEQADMIKAAVDKGTESQRDMDAAVEIATAVGEATDLLGKALHRRPMPSWASGVTRRRDPARRQGSA